MPSTRMADAPRVHPIDDAAYDDATYDRDDREAMDRRGAPHETTVYRTPTGEQTHRRVYGWRTRGWTMLAGIALGVVIGVALVVWGGYEMAQTPAGVVTSGSSEPAASDQPSPITSGGTGTEQAEPPAVTDRPGSVDVPGGQ